MNAIVNFDFEGHGIRTVLREEMPWFVAADICRVLGLRDVSDAVRKLDEDEKGRASTPTLGGEQELLIVSESGLYTIVLRSRDAVTPGSVPHRFRKWVTAEVLPALRKTGTYSLPERPRRPLRPRFKGGIHPAEVRAWASASRAYHEAYGKKAAQELIEQSPLPQVSSTARGHSLLPAGKWRAKDALEFLLDLRVGDGLSLGDLVQAAVEDKKKRRDLEEYGVMLIDLRDGPSLIVADDHIFLRQGFEETEICYAWNDRLRLLPGAHRTTKPLMLNGKLRRGVLVPLAVVLGE
ncbi:Bro-N domain-containing protein [Ancylobacter sp. WKF20]|uniref:BRO-N domain-containing protein n=1 Tax=Ancylobacter sp. WKF20 TaxID=3039801 RepID=UPI002434471E|nr:Bro-N domain-containing protein [Ancylobacter sp. WKF20]WGD31205.1 Bro-N domain-containing protein [Ancylobacter sp. WKF20]